MTEEEFHEDLMQTVAARASATSDFTEAAFAQVVAEGLIDSGSIVDFTPCPYKHRNLRIDGYAFSDDEGVVEIFVSEFRGASEIETLSKADLDRCLSKAQSFADLSLAGQLHSQIDVADAAWGLAKQLATQAPALSRVRIHVLTDARLSAAVKVLPEDKRNDRDWSIRLWDLRAISRLMGVGEPEEIVIDFQEMFGSALACIPANSGSDEVASYLTVIPGNWLAEIYGRFSGRLLEQNVRTFLQVKGAVNKGIRRTILDEPHMFFAYNNGIAATAAEADFETRGGTLFLNRVHHLQIVNGGQTTASIYNVFRKDKAQNLDRIHVQMKLSVVRPERVNVVVPKISEYANSQNKVSAADFFSNHPFHVRMEEISRRLWAPAREGEHLLTHWFYERARGQYLNATTYLTPARKREFEAQNPRRQLVQKTDLAKVAMSFRQLPHVVSSGAQKNFARFAEHVAEAWEKRQDDFGEAWFRDMVSMTIIFRSMEKMVQEAEWYSQGFRAQIVTYTIAMVQHVLSGSKKSLELERIWLRQSVPQRLEQWLVGCAKEVHDRIIASSSLYGISNLTEWCKRERCWEDLKVNLHLSIPASIDDDLLGADELSGVKRSARREQRVLNGVEAQTAVVNKGSSYWGKLLSWAHTGTVMTPTEMDFLALASKPRSVPSAAQSERLLRIEKKAMDEGFKP